MPAFLAVRLNADTYPVDHRECVELEQADAELLALEGETEQDIIQAARHCDALLVISAKVPAPVIEALSRCRVLSRLGSGTDRIDVRSATERGIVVANVPDFCVNEQAEHTMALLLGWARQLPFMLDAMKQGNWNARHHPLVHRLAGRTVGLVGFVHKGLPNGALLLEFNFWRGHVIPRRSGIRRSLWESNSSH